MGPYCFNCCHGLSVERVRKHGRQRDVSCIKQVADCTGTSSLISLQLLTRKNAQGAFQVHEQSRAQPDDDGKGQGRPSVSVEESVNGMNDI